MKNSTPTKRRAEGQRDTKMGEQRTPRAYLRADQRREQILQAARVVFARTNLHGTRTKDLAAAASVNQATLFAHFESKEALFEAAVIQPVLDAMQGMHERARLYEAAKSNAELQELSEASTARHIQTMGDVFPLFVAAFFSDMAAGAKLYREKLAPLMKERAKVISGLIKKDLDPNFVELLTWGSFFAIAMDGAFAGKRWELPEIMRQLSVISSSGFVRDIGIPQPPTSKKRRARST